MFVNPGVLQVTFEKQVQHARKNTNVKITYFGYEKFKCFIFGASGHKKNNLPIWWLKNFSHFFKI